jgi:enterochelin esterase-like enzyme
MPGIGPLPGGRRISEVVTGPRSRIKATVWVVLPAGYNDPVNKDRRYPVIEFLPGYPGSPTTWLKALRLQETADAEIAAGRVQPFIAVLPTECTDVPQGPQVATWLASDVPRIIAQQARTLPFGRNWGMTGYSTGGFCTAKLVLKFPEIFGSGAIMSGYYSTGVDATTGSIFGGSRAVMNANDPVWLVTHRTPPPVNLLAVYSLRDPGTLGPTQRFLAAVRPPLKVDVIRLTTGGHNTQVWLSVEPQVLDWLSGHIS